MGFTVRFMLGTVLILLCSWSIQTTSFKRPNRQVSHDGSGQANEKFQEAQAENGTQSVVANLTNNDNNKPKTDFSTEHNRTIDKQNSVVGKLQKSESYKMSPQPEIGRSIDIEKYVSKDFHNKNNVYTLPVSADTERYLDPDFHFRATTHKHSDFSDHFDFDSELTTPKSTLFDQRYKEAVESVEQKLEHIDDSHELSSESESKENINLDKLYEETQRNDTKADLNYINYKNIVSNDTGSKNSLHKDLIVEAGTNLHFRSVYNHTTVIDEDDSGNNTIVKDPDDEKKVEVSTLSNLIPAKGDLDHAESVTSKSVVLTTRKSFTLTKPPSNKNSSHISILSNNIETETLKAINHVATTTDKSKGETETVPESFSKGTPIEIVKRLFTFNDVPRTEATIDTNHINKKSEQLLQENQVIPVHVEPPPTTQNTTESTPSEDMSRIMEIPPKSVVPLKKQLNESRDTLTPQTITSEEEKHFEKNNISVNTELPKITTTQEVPTTNLPEMKVTSSSESTTDMGIVTKLENETASMTKLEGIVSSLKQETTVSPSDLTTTSTTTTLLPKSEATTILPSKQEMTTASTFQPEITTATYQPETTTSTYKPEITTSISEPETTTLFPKSETLTPEISTTSPTKLEEIINVTKETEVETITSVVTETSISPWEKVTTQTTTDEAETISSPQYESDSTTVSVTESTTVETEEPTVSEPEITTFGSTYLSDSTAATTSETTENLVTTLQEETTTEEVFTKMSEHEIVKNVMTTEGTVRTSKEMVYKNITTPSISVTTAEVTTVVTTVKSPETTTLPNATTERVIETVETTMKQTTVEEHEPTAGVVTHSTRIFPNFKHAEKTDSPVDLENTTENNAITSDFYEHSTNNTDPPEDNSGTIAAITISSIGAVCLILLAGLLVVMRKRQKRFNYGQRCTPVSLDDYSMDNVSVYNSVRRKGMVRGSKRSYGNPAFEDPVCVSHPLNFPALGKFANNLEDIKAEFEEIPQITARTNELPEGCDTKNRYANVIPLPETRVFLSSIDGYPNSDYINANYVTGPKNTKGYYIACQAPLQNTVDDFWRMIWEQQCKVVLMLTHLFENGVEKCVDYLPPSEVLDCHRLFGDFQVTLKKREVKDKYIISSLQLKNMVSNSWREVTHFWYLGWPEKGVPSEANSLIAFLIEARSYMKSSSIDRKDVINGNLTNGMTKNELNPVVVHCSPGTGRTGVVIACDIAIREFEQTRLVDVPRIVYKIRRDRASAVQTKEQYAFIYKVINLYATKLTGGALDSL